jgi:chaperonin cofactor prefoldin
MLSMSDEKLKNKVGFIESKDKRGSQKIKEVQLNLIKYFSFMKFLY